MSLPQMKTKSEDMECGFQEKNEDICKT